MILLDANFNIQQQKIEKISFQDYQQHISKARHLGFTWLVDASSIEDQDIVKIEDFQEFVQNLIRQEKDSNLQKEYFQNLVLTLQKSIKMFKATIFQVDQEASAFDDG